MKTKRLRLVDKGLYPHLREDIKYYFADFVRKGVPPPLPDTNVAEKIYGFEEYFPLSLKDFPTKQFFKKG